MSRLWPAYALALPWLILRATHALSTDVTSGSAVARIVARLPAAAEIFRLLFSQITKPWLWIAVIFGIAIARRRELFVPFVAAIQLAFYAAVYFATPHDPLWHIRTSWTRISEHVALPLAFSVVLMLANSLRREEDASHAEARSDQ